MSLWKSHRYAHPNICGAQSESANLGPHLHVYIFKVADQAYKLLNKIYFLLWPWRIMPSQWLRRPGSSLECSDSSGFLMKHGGVDKPVWTSHPSRTATFCPHPSQIATPFPQVMTHIDSGSGLFRERMSGSWESRARFLKLGTIDTWHWKSLHCGR